MILRLSKRFKKQVRNLLPAQQKRLHGALSLFLEDPYHKTLYNHALSGQWKEYRSISFGGDWRAHYKMIDQETAYFVAIGTHSQLYS